MSYLRTLLCHVFVLLLHEHCYSCASVIVTRTIQYSEYCYFMKILVTLDTTMSYTCSTLTWIYYHTEHCHFMYIYHCYTDTVTLDTIISCSCTTDTRIRYFTRYRYFIYSYHRYTNTLYTIISCSYNTVTQIHLYTGIGCFCILDTWIIVLFTWIFSYLCYMTVSCY